MPYTVSSLSTMQTPQWSKEYETGFPVIDQQHQEMFGLVGELQQAMVKPNQEAEIKSLIEQLLQDTVNHFALEEGLMLEHDYPSYEEHKQIHDRLTRKIQKVLHSIETEKDTSIINTELSHFLHQWLVHHIQGQDQKMIQFFREKNIRDAIPTYV